MSSHHFVREGQEPALLIVNALSMDVAGPLLEWAPHVVVIDTALEEVITWGIKIDFVLLADESYRSIIEQLQTQQPTQIFSYVPGHILQRGIELLKKEHNTAVNVLVDDANSLMLLPEARSFEVTFLTRDIRWSLIEKGHFEKWLPSRTPIRILTVGSEVPEVSGMDLSDSTYWTVSDGLVSIKSHREFWVGEFL